jgi:hypothetical protein
VKTKSASALGRVLPLEHDIGEVHEVKYEFMCYAFILHSTQHNHHAKLDDLNHLE